MKQEIDFDDFRLGLVGLFMIDFNEVALRFQNVFHSSSGLGILNW